MARTKKKAIKPRFDTREAWLLAATDWLRPLFTAAALTPPAAVSVSVGWPSRGALSQRNQIIGQCFGGSCAADKTPAIFISPILGTDKQGGALRILDVLLHEMVHAIMPDGEGHGSKFAKAARVLGFEGKPTHTTAGKELKEKLAQVLKKLGALPHAALSPSTKHKPQATRLLKAACGDCGYIIRVTRKWVDDSGLPTCPCGTEFELAS